MEQSNTKNEGKYAKTGCVMAGISFVCLIGNVIALIRGDMIVQGIRLHGAQSRVVNLMFCYLFGYYIYTFLRARNNASKKSFLVLDQKLSPSGLKKVGGRDHLECVDEPAKELREKKPCDEAVSPLRPIHSE